MFCILHLYLGDQMTAAEVMPEWLWWQQFQFYKSLLGVGATTPKPEGILFE